MRVRGRKVWASTLEERRVLMALGGMPLRVPRGVSPYMVARRLARAAASEHPDVLFVRDVLARGSGGPSVAVAVGTGVIETGHAARPAAA